MVMACLIFLSTITVISVFPIPGLCLSSVIYLMSSMFAVIGKINSRPISTLIVYYYYYFHYYTSLKVRFKDCKSSTAS